MNFKEDYTERVYAGVLGKVVGVYLGRPFENWTYERITERFGAITHYVHEDLGKPLIVADDDLSGTFRFLRAIADVERIPDLTAAIVGQTWRNLLIENRTTLWWGGMGTSTEHTAFERLKRGILAPLSGAIATNGRTVAEQIGGQIFIDGWAMLCPGDPEQAAYLAQQAASVSHDGEAVYAAQVIAAMESAAFIEPDINTLLETARRLIPPNCLIGKVLQDIREWHGMDDDWQITRSRIAKEYGYDRFPGHCHVVPNHALILLGLLYGEGDFNRSLMIVNTCGWDTDCNSGNLGCLLGIRNGLGQFAPDHSSVDWLAPVADRLYLVSANCGAVVSDALTEAEAIVREACRLSGQAHTPAKHGARFHFSQQHAVQGFTATCDPGCTLSIANEIMPGSASRMLALHYDLPAYGAVFAMTRTFVQPQDWESKGYNLIASPKLYPGQQVSAMVRSSDDNHHTVFVRLCCEVYDVGAGLKVVKSDPTLLAPGSSVIVYWTLPSTKGLPIANIGLALESDVPTRGVAYLDWLTWDGSPHTRLENPSALPMIWQRAWVNAADDFGAIAQVPYCLRHGLGTGLVMSGSSDWADYTVETTLWTTMMRAGGLAVRVQGLRRYIAAVLTADAKFQIIQLWDNTYSILASQACHWGTDVHYKLQIRAYGSAITATLNDEITLCAVATLQELHHGCIGLLVEDGTLLAETVVIMPIDLE